MGDIQQPFRFTDLVPEIRNAIYEVLLCTIPAPRDDSNDDLVVVATEPTSLDKNQINTAILLTSRQVHAEARAVLFKTNLFVKVEVLFSNFENEHKLHSLIVNRRVPLLKSRSPFNSRNSQASDSLLAMTYRITDTSTNHTGDREGVSYLLLHRDFVRLCRSLANADSIWLSGYAATFDHRVTIHEENGRSSESGSTEHGFFNSRVVQSRLLAPFKQYFSGIANFSIRSDSAQREGGNMTHNLHADLVSEVTAKVKRQSVKTTLDILAEFRDLKEQGMEAYHRGDTRNASEHWARACLNITRLRNGPEWPMMVAAASSRSLSAGDLDKKAFVVEVVDMLFTLNLNLAQNTIRTMEQKHAENTEESRDLVPQLANSALGALERAHGIGMEGPAGLWTPSATQWAKLWFRKAKTHRLCGDKPDALQAIAFAQQVAPADTAVLREKRLIESLP